MNVKKQKENGDDGEVAFIESHIFDQGGWSECSNCKTDLTKLFSITHCPGCGRKLEYGNTTMSVDGSDF